MEKKIEKPTVFSEKAPKPINHKDLSERVRKENKKVATASVPTAVTGSK